MRFKILVTLSVFFFSNCIIAETDLVFKSSFEPTLKLNDTGITWGGDFISGNNSTCISNIISLQDCHQGRDATDNDNTDGHAGFSFTKLDIDGIELPADSTEWSCVRDNITGLVWEVKTDDGGIHDQDTLYRWGGATHLGSNYGTYYNDWDSLVNGSNSTGFCGFNDWRVPNSQELMGIVDNSFNNPSIDINYFPRTNSSYFWSASPNASNLDDAWVVVFDNGNSYGNGRDNFGRVRLVHFGQ